jgi:putative phosphoserine phosphatase/1-acylglycerol-3-phosphate O-acyltransferase
VVWNHFERDDHGLLTGGIVKPIAWGAMQAAAVQQFCAGNHGALHPRSFRADGDEKLDVMSLVGYRGR